MSQIWTSNRRLHKKNRRQQKKLKLGEFQELIFDLELHFHQAQNDSSFNALVSEFTRFLESRDLCLWGMTETPPVEHAYGLIATPGFGATTQEDRIAVLDWLTARTEIAHAHAGDLADAHYVLL